MDTSGLIKCTSILNIIRNILKVTLKQNIWVSKNPAMISVSSWPCRSELDIPGTETRLWKQKKPHFETKSCIFLHIEFESKAITCNCSTNRSGSLPLVLPDKTSAEPCVECLLRSLHSLPHLPLYIQANTARQPWDTDSQSFSPSESSKDKCFFLRSGSDSWKAPLFDCFLATLCWQLQCVMHLRVFLMGHVIFINTLWGKIFNTSGISYGN